MKKDRDIAAWLVLIFCVIAVLCMLFQSWQRSHEIENSLKKPALFIKG